MQGRQAKVWFIQHVTGQRIEFTGTIAAVDHAQNAAGEALYPIYCVQNDTYCGWFSDKNVSIL